MSHEEIDKPVKDLVAGACLPADLCPSDPKAIEAMLDKARGRPLSDEQVERMLKKAKGELPVGEREGEPDVPWPEDALTAEQKELVYVCRNEGKELPPEIEAKLRRLREKAQAEGGEEGDDELDV